MSAKTTRKLNRERIAEHVGPIAESFGLALLDVVYTHEGGRSVLRLIIDKKGGVSMEDCEKLNNVADPLISETLGIDDFEVFEVSSPGLDWPLTTLADCLRHEGEYAEISLYQAVDGKKRFTGYLTVDETAEKVGVRDKKGEIVMFPMKAVAHIRREVDF